MSLKENLHLLLIYIFISSCSSSIYNGYDEPILTENTFIVNDTIVKKNPVKFLIQPSTPINKFLGYPLGLYVYRLSNDNPDERFDSWINKKPKPKRYAMPIIAKYFNHAGGISLSFKYGVSTNL